MPSLVIRAGASLVAVSLAAAPAAQARTDSTPRPSARAASRAAAGRPALHHVSGTLESYDAEARTITVQGTRDTWTFEAGDARVWDGSRSVGLDDLGGRRGAKVTVKYTEDGAARRAISLRLAAGRVPKSK